MGGTVGGNSGRGQVGGDNGWRQWVGTVGGDGGLGQLVSWWVFIRTSRQYIALWMYQASDIT